MSRTVLAFAAALLALLAAHPAAAQEAVAHAVHHDVAYPDLRMPSETHGPVFLAPLFPSDTGGPARKSPLLAAGLSLVVPGAGQVYAESYWLAPIFLAAEAVGIWVAIDYNRKGDAATQQFQDYADAHWSVVKYAAWLNENAKNFAGGENAQPIEIDPNTALPPWQRVNWTEMNAVESMIPVFSHRLPTHGQQQYFELIGKYDQYCYGWDDKLVGGGDGWSDYRQTTPNYRSYSLQRGHANDLYTTGETVVSLLILNHVLSALEAAWAASRFNNTVELHTRVEWLPTPGGAPEPTARASVRIRF